MIRYYKEEDIQYINELGKILHDNYQFNLDIYSRCLVIENDGIIGFISYSVIYERAEIIDIIITSNERNKGYGKKLLDSMIDDCKKSGCINITLEVKKSNVNAIDFYQKNGFKIVSKRKKYYDNEDGYLMCLEVK